jgi:hypothetical protein
MWCVTIARDEELEEEDACTMNDDLSCKEELRRLVGLEQQQTRASGGRTITWRWGGIDQLYDDANGAPFAVSLSLSLSLLFRSPVRNVFSLQPDKRLYPIIPSKLLSKLVVSRSGRTTTPRDHDVATIQ